MPRQIRLGIGPALFIHALVIEHPLGVRKHPRVTLQAASVPYEIKGADSQYGESLAASMAGSENSDLGHNNTVVCHGLAHSVG